MFDVESMKSGASEVGVATACLGGSSKLVRSGADNPARVNTVQVVVGGFRKQLLAVDAEMIERCGRPFDDPFLEVQQVSQ